VNLQTALPELIGDLTRFGVLADRIEDFVDTQAAQYRPAASDWIVLPWTAGFYLFSEDNEGQRRGREVITAFLGPSIVVIETLPDQRHTLPAAWTSTGLTRASYLRRVGQGHGIAEQMLSRLEDMAATIANRTWHSLTIVPTPSDLLRDYRLAILRKDDESARALLDQVRSTGQVSAENLRYLRIEYLAAFDRWAEMRAQPHISALLQARRPRAVSESLLRMLWWTELVAPGYADPQTAFQERGVLDEFGPLLRSVHAPSSVEGRFVCFLTALADHDFERQTAILDRASNTSERATLEALASGPPLAEEVPAEATQDPIAEAYAAGRFAEVIAQFLQEPKATYSEIAIAAILDSVATEHAVNVLELVQGFDNVGTLTLTRRARRDLEELQRLVADTCDGWPEWAARISTEARWADASTVARDSQSSWRSIALLDAQQTSQVCDALLNAADGLNADQLRASLDLLCHEAASSLSRGGANDFCQVVLMLLSVQDNFSEMVRAAYVDLLAAWLQVGPSSGEYAQMLNQTDNIWRRIASPIAVAWAIATLEIAIDSPCPDHAKRTAFAVQMLESLRQYRSRLSLRERVEIESLATELGLPAQTIEAQEPERDVWTALNGKIVGIYSLLPRAAEYLRSRLAQLCAVGEVRANSDQVATQALRSLAERADYLIVDTWHAAHQATAAIDSVRAKENQILPRQRGVSGFLRALEEALVG
jgi:hypothetical protein